MRIRGGPCAGCRWSLASTGRGYWPGTFNRERVEAIVRLTRPDMHVWDVGAHKGYVALALSRAVGPTGTVASVEPSRQNLGLLRRHLAWNRAGNVTVIEAAVSDYDGEALFGGRGSTTALKLGEGGERVRVARLATLHETDGLPLPDLLKLDIEGAEAGALEGAGAVLGERTIVFVSVHSREQHARCTAELARRGFRIVESAAMRMRTADPALPWGGDHELLALGAACGVAPPDVEGLELFGGRSPA